MSLTPDNAISIIFWLLVLVALIVAGFVLVAWARRGLKATDDTAPGGFTLSDLRDLRRQGKMTDEEFERAKAGLLAALRAKEAPPKDSPKE